MIKLYYTFIIFSRPEAHEEQRPASSGAQKSAGGGGVAMWLKLVFFVSVAALVYLVVINMNPSAENKIPLTLDEKENWENTGDWGNKSQHFYIRKVWEKEKKQHFLLIFEIGLKNVNIRKCVSIFKPSSCFAEIYNTCCLIENGNLFLHFVCICKSKNWKMSIQ